MGIVVKDLNEYQTLALRTVKPDNYLHSVSHCAMGMAGEVGEFFELPHTDRDKRIGEIGDCMWYSAVLAHLLGWQFEFIIHRAEDLASNPGSEFHLRSGEEVGIIWAARLIDIVKKSVFYGKQLDNNKVTEALVGYCAGLVGMSKKMSTPLLQIGTLNIKKLSERYKDGRFDAGHAVNRDTVAEAKAAGIGL